MDTTKPGTLVLSIYTEAGLTAAVGNLIAPALDGGRDEVDRLDGVIRTWGDDPLRLMWEIARLDIQVIRPSQVMVYTNDAKLIATYRKPVRLDVHDPIVWETGRILFVVGWFRLRQMDGKYLTKARELWEQQR
jgi:hypothetical protein